ncbi:MAG TPA: Ldh family oxidoreductase [Candidatus Omnitrophota bacterium]|nr:Ldh family oxidoreductase [Candidatus Omnitrophota bacterium]HPD85577.1 Ldh family oxidoreductase [Candidatus Omnitrophota bacterium]HRZ04383.1 Ldh family oxidoreductase [Candidatus Omnitrophota bacterium]
MAFKYLKENLAREFFRDIFSRIRCPRKLSAPVIDGLIESSLRGVDSHGVRLLPHYVQAALIGRINLSPRLTFKKTSLTTVLMNADHTFGIAAAGMAMEKAIQVARRCGVGCVAVYNSTHFGAASIYALMAAKENMLGFSFTNVEGLVIPFGGKRRFLGTNPICFAAPCRGEEPFCLDMATSMISWNKLMQYQAKGKRLEAGWAADKNGKICLNAAAANALLPIGGYKGYGLGLMVEILCGVLTGMPWGPHIENMFPVDGKKRRLGHFLMAIDISKFQNVGAFKSRLKKLLTELRSVPPAKGFGRVRVAGDPEKEAYRVRRSKGIAVEASDVVRFRSLARKLKIDEQKYSFLKS